MKRNILILALAGGTVLGFGHGFSSLARCHAGHEARRAAFEDHVADVCVDAAMRAQDREAAYVNYEPPPPRYEPHAQGCDHGDEARPRHRRHRRERARPHVRAAHVAPAQVAPARIAAPLTP